MKLQMMSVYDHKARAFLPPFFVAHVDVGLRSIQAAANNPEHQLCRYAEDFEIFHLGEWDDDSGVTTPRPIPFTYGRVSVLKALAEPTPTTTAVTDPLRNT